MAPNEFFVVNEGARPPSRNSRIPPPPPNHHRPPTQGGGIPPRIVNAAPHPADMAQAQRPGPPPPQPPPQPQQPLIFQHEPPVRISDIRKERLTPDEAREELSEYFIYRFEPSQRVSDYDDGDELDRKPNWESVFVMEVRGVSKKEAARQVRHLNQTTWSLGDKKSTLSGAQQRQIEKVLEELQARDHPFFQTNLVQINHQLGPAQIKVKHDKHHKHHKHNSKHIKDYRQLFRDPKHHKKSSSSSKEKKKPKPQERISLTAYYKRSPKPEMDALVIYHQREAHFRKLQQPPPPPPPPVMGPPPEAAHHHGPEGGQAKSGGGNNGGGGWNSNKGPGGGKNGGPVATVVHPEDRKRGGGGRRASRSPPRSPLSTSSNSDRSFISETFSINDDLSTITPSSDTSSLGERRGSFHRHRPRKDRQYRLEGPAFFGIRHHNDPRVQGREVHRIADEFSPLMAPAPLPPRLIQPAVDIEQIKSNAYEAGRADERADVERIADKIAIATVSAVQQPPIRPPPRRLQHRPSIRLVHPGDVSHEEATLERLERLDLRGEALDEARYILADGPGRRRVYPRREEVWEGDNRAPRRPLDEALDRIRRTDAAADIPFMENPFAPNPDDRRRSSPGRGDPYYTDFRRRDDFDLRIS